MKTKNEKRKRKRKRKKNQKHERIKREIKKCKHKPNCGLAVVLWNHVRGDNEFESQLRLHFFKGTQLRLQSFLLHPSGDDGPAHLANPCRRVGVPTRKGRYIVFLLTAGAPVCRFKVTREASVA